MGFVWFKGRAEREAWVLYRMLEIDRRHVLARHSFAGQEQMSVLSRSLSVNVALRRQCRYYSLVAASC